MKGTLVFTYKGLFNPQKRDNDFFLFINVMYACYQRMCLLIRTVSNLSEVAHMGPLFLVVFFNFHRLHVLSQFEYIYLCYTGIYLF